MALRLLFPKIGMDFHQGPQPFRNPAVNVTCTPPQETPTHVKLGLQLQGFKALEPVVGCLGLEGPIHAHRLRALV
jgi:hypothetical protein